MSSLTVHTQQDPASPGLFLVNLPLDQQLASLASVFHAAPVGLCVLDLAFRYVTVNSCFARMYRLRVQDFVGRTVEETLPGPALQITTHLREAIAADQIVEREIVLADPSPTPGEAPGELTFLRTAQPVKDPSGKIVGISVALVDITARKRSEAALRESEEDLRFTVQLTPHLPWHADADGKLTFMSPRWGAITGKPVNDVVLGDWTLAVHPEDRPATLKVWHQSLRTGEPYDHEYRVKIASGSWRWMRARAYPRRSAAGEIIRWYGTVEDIHDRKLVEKALQIKTEALARSAQEDHLTGLANRRLFDEVLTTEIKRARRARVPLALALLDVDHFKRYNDTWGHLAGDECLRMIATAIDGVIRRPGDLAARYGGEEFAIILPNTSRAGALEVANKALAAVRALELPVGDQQVQVTISAGIAILDIEPGDETINRALPLIEAADSALYRAKAQGRNCVVDAANH